MMGGLPEPPSSIRDRYRKQRSRLGWFGAGLSAVYIVTLCVVLSFIGWAKFQTLTPNEVGDFLAGAFAPLAFFWLVIGYKQQSIELSLNTDTLVSQVEEMRQSVAQQTKQASSLESNESHTRRDAIIKLTDLYVARLAGSASVIGYFARGLRKERLENAWTFYSGGDREYFFRFLISSESQIEGLAADIERAMGLSQEVRDACADYTDTYGRYIRQIQSLDTTKDFLPLLEGSSAGLVYRAIMRVVMGPEKTK